MGSKEKASSGKIIFLFSTALIALPLLFSCCTSNKTSKSKKNNATKSASAKIYTIVEPERNKVINQNDIISITLAGNENQTPDSIHLVFDKHELTPTKTGDLDFTTTAQTKTVGNKLLQIKLFFSDSLSESHNLPLFVLPTEEPKNYSYKVLRTFQHDARAYTQGLLYNNGYIYESTGKEKRSSIRRLDVETGEVINKAALEPEFFGEGIAIVGKEIYMLTYVSQVGFVFDAVTLDIKRKFNLQTREGWGLTTYNNELILSDGTANIYFFEPEYFSLIRQLEVCTNKGLVGNLNELEYTPYGLLANVYGENFIVLIDEQTGIVKGKLDLTPLFPEGLPKNLDHVLNGIAFNPDKQTFYVTGKQWPVMYEISINLD